MSAILHIILNQTGIQIMSNKFVALRTGAPGEEASAIFPIRPPGMIGPQGDHTTALAVLDQLLLKVLSSSYSQDEQMLHSTPVIEKLANMAQQELFVFSHAMRLEEHFVDLISKVCPEEETRIKDLFAGPGDPLFKKSLFICESFFKLHNKDHRRPVFLQLYSKLIPYQNLIILTEELKEKTIEAEETVDLKAAQEKVKLKINYKHLKKTAPSIQGLPDDARKTIRAELIRAVFPHIKNEVTLSNIELLLNSYATWLNKLPFVAFNAITDVSGKTRHAGSGVSSAITHLSENGDTLPNEQVVTYIALLLDYHPLTKDKLVNQTSLKNAIMTSNDSFSKQASVLAITRDNDEQTFAYVVAKHWQIICDTFPKLNKDGQRKEDIKQQFIDHMLARWWCADKEPRGKVPKDSTSYAQELQETQEKRLITPMTSSSKWEITVVNPAGAQINTEECRNLILGIIAKYDEYQQLSLVYKRNASLTPDDLNFSSDSSSSFSGSSSPTDESGLMIDKTPTVSYSSSNLLSSLKRERSQQSSSTPTSSSELFSPASQKQVEVVTSGAKPGKTIKLAEDKKATSSPGPTITASVSSNLSLKDSLLAKHAATLSITGGGSINTENTSDSLISLTAPPPAIIASPIQPPADPSAQRKKTIPGPHGQ